MTEQAQDAAEDAVDAEVAFRKGFKAQRGVDNVRVQPPKAEASFAKQVNRQVKQGDAGGEGRTQNAPPVKAIPSGHDVKEGDTMWVLAKRYGISVEEIQRLNEGVDPTRMKIGSKLRLTNAPPPQAAPQQQQQASKTLEKFDQHMAKFDPRADAITPVAPLESLIGGAGVGKAVYQGGKAAYQAAKSKGPELSATMQRILSGRGARPAQQGMRQDERMQAMEQMAHRGPPTGMPSRAYPNEAPPPWLVPPTRGRR
jgi:LysM repeat protein